jgi:hypothetical protein
VIAAPREKLRFTERLPLGDEEANPPLLDAGAIIDAKDRNA